MDQNQQEGGVKKAGLNIWLIASILLAVALVGVLAKDLGWGAKSEGKLMVLGADETAKSLIDFINKIYGPQVGTATLKDVAEENGLYKVNLTVLDQGQPVDQSVFVSRDGKLFIPQVIEIDKVNQQFEAMQQQQQQAPTNANVTPESSAAPPAQENTNTAE